MAAREEQEAAREEQSNGKEPDHPISIDGTGSSLNIVCSSPSV